MGTSKKKMTAAQMKTVKASTGITLKPKTVSKLRSISVHVGPAKD